jgi:hypothetical protein
MPRGVRKFFSRELPSVEDLGTMKELPQLPKSYRQKLWRTIKVSTTLKLPEETEHFMNILCLHFGLSRNDLVLHAINLLWSEVVDTVGADRIKLYEDKLEAVRLWRLEGREAKTEDQKNRLAKAMEEFHQQGVSGRTRTTSLGTTFFYKPEKRVLRWDKQNREEGIDEEEIDLPDELKKTTKSKKK